MVIVYSWRSCWLSCGLMWLGITPFVAPLLAMETRHGNSPHHWAPLGSAKANLVIWMEVSLPHAIVLLVRPGLSTSQIAMDHLKKHIRLNLLKPPTKSLLDKRLDNLKYLCDLMWPFWSFPCEASCDLYITSDVRQVVLSRAETAQKKSCGRKEHPKCPGVNIPQEDQGLVSMSQWFTLPN